MRKIFQRRLLLFILIAFIITFALTFFVQTQQAVLNVVNMAKLKIADVERQLDTARKNLQLLQESVNENALSKARAMALLLKTDATALTDQARLTRLAGTLGVDEVNVIDEKGIIVMSTVESFIGFDMASTEQSRGFLDILRNPKAVRIDPPKPRGADQVLFQYIGVARLDQKGVVEIGYVGNHMEAIYGTANLEQFIQGARLGNNGTMLILRNGMIEASGLPGYVGKTLADIGLFGIDFTKEVNEEINWKSQRALAVLKKESDGRIIIGVIPQSEIFNSRDSMAWFLIFCNVVVFVLIFVLVSNLLQRQVIAGIDNVNVSLAKITNGDLEEKVHVRTNPEFKSLSNGINAMVEALRKAMKKIAEAINAELEFARSIQLSAMPRIFPPFPQHKEFEIFALIETAKEVGGDFYDFFLIDDHRLGVVIADVSGKGIPAALFMMTAKTALKNLAASGLAPNKVVESTNEYLCQNNDAGMFVTLFFGILDLDNGLFEYANAGHNPPLVCEADGSYKRLDTMPGLVLGAMNGIKYVQRRCELKPGTRLLLYTDGVTEALNPAGELFGEERLLNFLNTGGIKSENVTVLLHETMTDLRRFIDTAPAADDITMLALEYKGGKMERRGEMNVAAQTDNLPKVLEFIRSSLQRVHCSQREMLQVELAVEEIFVNIANYAYTPGSGEVSVHCDLDGDPPEITLQFFDSGKPFNPLENESPDTTLSAEDREIGGLGVLLSRKNMDFIGYEYKDNRNVLTMRKFLNPQPEK